MWRFNKGFAGVKLNGKYNFINTEGELLSKQWFDDMGHFKDGFAKAQLNDKWNFINTEGQILSKQWFDNVTSFNDGFAEVFLNDKWGKIDTDGNFTLEESRRASSPVITESILRRTITEYVRRILSEK